MRSCRALFLLGILVLCVPALGAEVDRVEIENSSITRVTVYADRAQVTREAKLRPARQQTTYAFTGLPGWVDDATVRLRLAPVTAGRIVDVRVQREYLARATDAEYRKAEAAVQEINDSLAVLDDELAVLDAQARQIEAIRAFSLEKIPREMPVREVKVQSFREVVSFITESLRETATARRQVELKRRELLPELSARQRRLNELRSLTQLEQTTVLVVMEGRNVGATLELTYMLPGATWEPVHELRADGANPQAAEVVSYAVVTQTSGEDWKDAKIAFSTQSSTESMRIPQVTALTLGDSHAAARVVQERTESFHRAQAAFEGQNQMWNLRNVKGKKGVKLEVYQQNVDQLQLVQTRAEQTFLQLRRRGTTAHFNGGTRATVRADGHPVRVRIGEADLAAAPEIVAVPEQSLNAARTLKMRNTGDQPLLPGSVALFRDGAFLGMTDIDFVAEGESFSVFLGTADRVKLSRVLDRKRSSIRRKKRTRMDVAFIVTVENLSEETVTVHLADRIPISENKAIEVSDIEVSGDKDPDSRGLLKWTLNLEPGKKRSFRIEYRLEYPPALVQQMHRQRIQRKQSMPSKAMDFEDDDVSEQIMNLESSFH